MGEVQRYSVWRDFHDRVDEIADPDGEHVRYEDHAASLAAKDEEIRRLKNLNAVYEGRTEFLCECGGRELELQRATEGLAAKGALLQRAKALLDQCHRLRLHNETALYTETEEDEWLEQRDAFLADAQEADDE